ncbi:MAG: metallophosphoesterase [Acidobacteria bacterium]|nr:metallophosphoesterase [Acidobacteriota bacterium]
MTDNATMTTPGPRRATMCALLLLAVFAWPPSATSQDANQPDDRRIVAIADIHGALESFTSILREVGLVDDDLHWSGGDTILVQTGDFTDRGPEVRACMDLLMRLQQEARAHGGEVVVMLGNHEGMNLVGLLRDNNPADAAGFIDDDSEDRRDQAYEEWTRMRRQRAASLDQPQPRFDRDVRRVWEESHPLGYVERMQAFGPNGRYGRWLRSLATVAELDGILFMHAGLNPVYAAKSVEEMNELVASDLRRFDEAKAEMVDAGLITEHADLGGMVKAADEKASRLMAILEETGEPPGADDRRLVPTLDWVLKYQSWEMLSSEGLLWFRGLALWPEDEHDADVRELLDLQEIEHIVVGHTVQLDGIVKTRFDGAVFLADTGMLTNFYNGRPSALEIEDGRFTAVYVGERRQLYPPTDDDVLEFLRTADVVSIEDLGSSKSGARRVELEKDGVRARGIFHVIDFTRERVQIGERFHAIFRDSWRGQVAAYWMARELGLTNVPPTVQRTICDEQGSLQLWLENDGIRTNADRVQERDFPPDIEGWLGQEWVMNVFDALVFNDDRNPGNVLVDGDWKLWMIDHTRAFQSDSSIRNPEKLWRIDRHLWTALHELTAQRLATLLGPYLERSQINAVMARRDAIVEHFRRRIEESGEENVFYDLVLRPTNGGTLAEGVVGEVKRATCRRNQTHHTFTTACSQGAARLPGSFLAAR